MPRARRQDSSEEESDAGPSRQASGSTQRKRGRPSTQNRRDADSDEDSDDAGGATQTQLKGKGKQTADKLTSQDLSTRAWDIVRLAMCSECSRKPLTRAEINKQVMGANTRQFKEAVSLAHSHALASLGMELVELRDKGTGYGVDHNKSSGPQSKGKKKKKRRNSDSDSSSEEEQQQQGKGGDKWEYIPGKQYILRSVFDPKVIAKAADVDSWPEERDTALVNVAGSEQLHHTGLLYVILALVLVSGRSIGDQTLRQHLKKLDIMPSTDLPLNSSTAPSTANAKLNIEGLLKSFAQQGFLERITIGGSTEASGRGNKRQRRAEADEVSAQTGLAAGGDANVEWRSGPRADAEIGETNLAKFICAFFEDEAAAEASQSQGQASQGRSSEVRKTIMRNMGKAAGGYVQKAVPPHPSEV